MYRRKLQKSVPFMGITKLELQQERERFEKRWKLDLRDTASLDDFELGRTIGIGAFGRVLYAEHKKNKHGYALKLMSKERIVRLNQVERVVQEKRILQSLVHPFHVDLRFVFKTNAYLYIIMPFVPGGEIYSYLKKRKMFTEYQTRFYAAQVILALEYMHRMSLLYRDLKPENVILQCDGYIKLTDLGFAKRIDGMTTSFVGTPEYMAPEVLLPESRKAGYSYSVDWWALGVFSYEMAAGKPPFTGSSLLQIFDRIVKIEFSIPNGFSLLLEDFLVNLFQSNIDKRIGGSKVEGEEFKNHQWFSNLDWDALMAKKIPPPFIPNCGDKDPTINFDQYEEILFQETAEELYKDEFKMF